ncbi:MAG TPA: nuclear transport factor 2 family protein [Chryseolinea sp.]|nr:nuclear transport factor 2 family protein [Chryseolinea sp.]
MMKSLLALFTVGLCMTSCMDNGSKTDSENIAVVEKYIKAVETKDTQAMSELLADNYVGYGPSFTDSTNKEQAIASFKDVSENLYEKIEYQRTVNIAAKVKDGKNPGDYVSDWAALKITYKDGRGPVMLTMNAVYRIENGKINLSRSFYNEADVLRQLGYDFYPAE